MFCSTCGGTNSDAAKFCYQCGQSILFPSTDLKQVEPSVSNKETKEKNTSRFYKMLTLVCCVIIAALGTVALFNKFYPHQVPQTTINETALLNTANQNTPAHNPTQTPKTKQKKTPLSITTETQEAENLKSDVLTVVDETFPVAPGAYRYYQFTLVKQSRVSGRIEASGGSDDIDTIILDADEFRNFQNTGRFRAYYRSGYITVSAIDLTLNPGKYFVVFSNSTALLTNKVVKANLVAE